MNFEDLQVIAEEIYVATLNTVIPEELRRKSIMMAFAGIVVTDFDDEAKQAAIEYITEHGQKFLDDAADL